MQRAADKTAQMQARAQTIDGLLASGALDDATVTGGRHDEIQAELDKATGSADVERELTALKANPAIAARDAGHTLAAAITAAPTAEGNQR